MSQEMRKGAAHIGEGDNVQKPVIDAEKDKGYHEKKGFAEKLKEKIVGPPKEVIAGPEGEIVGPPSKEHLWKEKGHPNWAYKQELEKEARDGHVRKEGEKPHDGHVWKEGEKPHDGHMWKEGEKHGMSKDLAMKPSGYGYGENKKKHFGEHAVAPDSLSQELKHKTKDRVDEGVLSHDKSHPISSLKTDPLTKEVRAHANKIPKAPTLHDKDIQDKHLYDGALSQDHKIPKAPTLHDKDIQDKHLHDGALSHDQGLHKDGALRQDKGFHKDALHKSDVPVAHDKGFKHDPLRQDKVFEKDALGKDKAFKHDDPLHHDKGFGKEAKLDDLGVPPPTVPGQELARDKAYDTTHDEQQKGVLERAKESVARGLEKTKAGVKSMLPSKETDQDKSYNGAKVEGRPHWSPKPESVA